MIVVADTGPLRYLVLIGQIQVLGRLFDRVLIPDAVATELANTRTPEPVKQWMARRPDWVEVCAPPPIHLCAPDLDEGERQAIELARYLKISLILIDDAVGRLEARSCGLGVLGTVGILERAAQLGLLDFAPVFAELEKTNFHMSTSFRQLIRQRHHLDP